MAVESPVSSASSSTSRHTSRPSASRSWLIPLLLPFLTLSLPSVSTVQALTLPELRYRSIYQVVTDRFALDPAVHPASYSADAGAEPSRLPRCEPGERRYCGGSWKGIEARLGYIQGMGFDTVWISPVVANVDRDDAYHGYWGSNIFELNSHFGTPKDLLDLSNALHERGMYLMVDVVANHLGTKDFASWLPSSEYGPFDSPADFHPYCTPSDWENQEQIEQCWLDQRMPDLNTESPRVVALLHKWVRDLVRTYHIDAIRVDTVKHVRKSFWPDFVAASGVVGIGEVLHGDPGYLAGYQREAIPSLLDYATYWHLRRAFESPRAHIGELAGMIDQLHRTMPDPTALGVFLDNHDFPRFLGTVGDAALMKNAATFPFVGDGIPFLYMGQEHNLVGGEDPHNREAIWLHGYTEETEMYTFFRRLNDARKAATEAHAGFLTGLARQTTLNNHSVAVTKPPLLSVLTNYGSPPPAQEHGAARAAKIPPPLHHDVAPPGEPHTPPPGSPRSAPAARLPGSPPVVASGPDARAPSTPHRPPDSAAPAPAPQTETYRPVVPLYLPPSSTSYRALLPVIDVISLQIFTTDPRGGLSVPIVHGQPRVFLPLAVHERAGVRVGEWLARPDRIDVGEGAGAAAGSRGPSTPRRGGGEGGPGSPRSPTTGKRRSWMGVMGWLGGHGKGEGSGSWGKGREL